MTCVTRRRRSNDKKATRERRPRRTYMRAHTHTHTHAQRCTHALEATLRANQGGPPLAFYAEPDGTACLNVGVCTESGGAWISYPRNVGRENRAGTWRMAEGHSRGWLLPRRSPTMLPYCTQDKVPQHSRARARKHAHTRTHVHARARCVRLLADLAHLMFSMFC